MSPTELRRWAALAAAAFLLRAAIAIATEFEPIFPPYYYHDAAFAERLAANMAGAWAEGRAFRTRYSPPQRVHAFLMAVPYSAFGRRPLINKLINCALGAAGVALLGLALASAVSPRAGFLAAALVAGWPSHVFYTSQNFKESAMFVAVFGALAAALPVLAGRDPVGRRGAAAFFVLALAAGLLRSYALLVLSASVGLGALLALRTRPAARLLLAAALAAPIAYKGLSWAVFSTVLASPLDADTDDSEANFVREIRDSEGVKHHPLSPRGLSQFRALRQRADRDYAAKATGRDIGTQLFPDARFESWGDVALFMPKAAFYVLFMPLPGLYPLDGRIGRALASGENLVLLALAAAAALFLAHSPRPGPAQCCVLAFFAAMLAGSALLEFDLGSASRHKLLYFPMLFPFAAELVPRRVRS